MTREEIIQGLQFTIDMFLLDPTTGETYTEPRNDMDKTTIDACRGAIELLEQQPSDDVMAIHTQGLDEGIRCAMCTNSMKSDSGCDGGCVVNEVMYKKVMNTIGNHIVPSVTPTKCIATVKFSKEDIQELINEKMKEIVVERKKGKWIRHEERKPLKYGYELIIKGKCSNCGEVFGETYKMNYCPNCGSFMITEN